MGTRGGEAARRSSGCVHTMLKKATNDMEGKCTGFAWLQTGLAITIKEKTEGKWQKGMSFGEWLKVSVSESGAGGVADYAYHKLGKLQRIKVESSQHKRKTGRQRYAQLKKGMNPPSTLKNEDSTARKDSLFLRVPLTQRGPENQGFLAQRSLKKKKKKMLAKKNNAGVEGEERRRRRRRMLANEIKSKTISPTAENTLNNRREVNTYNFTVE